MPTKDTADAGRVDWSRMNAKYGAFSVMRWSKKTYRYIQSGKVHTTVESALCACLALDKKYGPLSAFVDIHTAALSSSCAEVGK